MNGAEIIGRFVGRSSDKVESQTVESEAEKLIAQRQLLRTQRRRRQTLDGVLGEEDGGRGRWREGEGDEGGGREGEGRGRESACEQDISGKYL